MSRARIFSDTISSLAPPFSEWSWHFVVEERAENKFKDALSPRAPRFVLTQLRFIPTVELPSTESLTDERKCPDRTSWIEGTLKPILRRTLLPDRNLCREDLVRVLGPMPYEEQLRFPELLSFGSTMSYSELTERLGLPRSHVRHVARMVSSNPIQMLIPCHRVIHKDVRAVPRYRWGRRHKEALLFLERSLV